MLDGDSKFGRRAGRMAQRTPLTSPLGWAPAVTAGSVLTLVDSAASQTRPSDELIAATGDPVTPALALLAAASFVEGYRWLHVLPVGRGELSTAMFVVVVLVVTLWFSHSHRGRLRPSSHRLVVTAVLVTTVATLAMYLSISPMDDYILGLSDLLVGAAVLGTVVLSTLRNRAPVATPRNLIRARR